MQILRVIDYDLYRRFCNAEVDDEYVIYEVFSQRGGKELLESDSGSVFAAVLVVGAWDLGGRPKEIRQLSNVYKRIRSRLPNNEQGSAVFFKQNGLEALIDRMDPVKSFHTLDLLISFVDRNQVSFRSVVDFVELFDVAPTGIEER